MSLNMSINLHLITTQRVETMFKTLSKFFRVALEGATTDGRNIERNWIVQMAKNFDPKKYGARVWMEHIRGVLPDGPFKAYGDVVALKAEEVEIDGIKKMALFAQIEPTPELVAMTKAKQKIYTSVEVNPKFADSGEAYLVGLGVTDSPASLGTDVLSFASQNPTHNPFAYRKSFPESLFCEATEVNLEFEEIKNQNSVLDKVKELIGKFSSKEVNDDVRFNEINEAFTLLLDHMNSQIEKQESAFNRIDEMKKRIDDLKKQIEEQSGSFSSLKQQLEKTPAQYERPTATGATGQVQTDC